MEALKAVGVFVVIDKAGVVITTYSHTSNYRSDGVGLGSKIRSSFCIGALRIILSISTYSAS